MMRLVKDASLHELVNGYDPVGFGWRGFHFICMAAKI